MRSTLLLIQNISSMNAVPEEVIEWVEDILDIMQEIMTGENTRS